MADTIAEMVPDLREALSVDASYDAVVLPGIITKCIKRLMRDYHFPKSLTKQTFTPILDQQAYALPAGFKKELLIRFYDPVEDTYGQPLLKREGPVLPMSDGSSCYYWREGGNLLTDITLAAENVGIELHLHYENVDPVTNEAWFVPDFEDVLFSYCMYRASAQLRKTELKKAWKELWAEDRTSLAIFANEIEFDNSELMMRETSPVVDNNRYPHAT